MMLRDRRARWLWRELGMDTWTPPPPVVAGPFPPTTSELASVESGPSQGIDHRVDVLAIARVHDQIQLDVLR